MVKIMCDLETMGNGSNAAIISIGAVSFDILGIKEKFYSRVDLASSVRAGGVIDASTVLWWMEQNKKARLELTKKSPFLYESLLAFKSWVTSIAKEEEVELWGNGATFDNVILRNSYKLVNLEAPWSFRGDRCYRTIKAMFPNIPLGENVRTVHNALDDAEYQALHLIKIFKELK